MKILDDGADDFGAHEFAVELVTGDEADGAQLRKLWESAPDKGDYGIPHALVRCEGGKVDTARTCGPPLSASTRRPTTAGAGRWMHWRPTCCTSCAGSRCSTAVTRRPMTLPGRHHRP